MRGKYFRSKKTPEQATEEIRKEYEDVIREQRQRITSLREDNAQLAQKLAGYEKYSQEIAGVLADARIKANEIVSDAKKRAERIVAEAEDKKRENDKLIHYYKSSLKELEGRSERILVSIQSELSRDRTRAFSLAANQ